MPLAGLPATKMRTPQRTQYRHVCRSLHTTTKLAKNDDKLIWFRSYPLPASSHHLSPFFAAACI